MAVAVSREIEAVVKSLKANRFAPVEFVKDAGAAVDLVLGMIPVKATVGVAGSTSVRQIGLVDRLKARGNAVIDINAPGDLSTLELQRRTMSSDVLLTSSNALTMDGKLVNIDGTGNRVSAMVFGPRKVILVIGTNKIVRDVGEALDRIKNVIAPFHARTRGDRTPCATKGYCTDCNSPARICRVTTIIEKRPIATDIAIVLVGEDLGLGWDPTWPEERRERIISVYRKVRSGFSPH